MLVIGEITLHFTNLSKFESIGKEQFTSLSFPGSKGKLILVKISKLCHKMPLNIMNALVECEARGAIVKSFAATVGLVPLSIL